MGKLMTEQNCVGIVNAGIGHGHSSDLYSYNLSIHNECLIKY